MQLQYCSSSVRISRSTLAQRLKDTHRTYRADEHAEGVAGRAQPSNYSRTAFTHLD